MWCSSLPWYNNIISYECWRYKMNFKAGFCLDKCLELCSQYAYIKKADENNEDYCQNNISIKLNRCAEISLMQMIILFVKSTPNWLLYKKVWIPFTTSTLRKLILPKLTKFILIIYSTQNLMNLTFNHFFKWICNFLLCFFKYV